ncbi:MAG: alpha/beta fold hydrolase [Burkholderiales bacterium]|nr:alpha/beta fold hydrolase [Burkholderiales bacterium]
MPPTLTRRTVLIGAATSTLLAACATPGRADPLPPIVFVHGNGDTAALWITTLWRFESNGWPRERLHAVDMPYPSARDDDTKPQEGRSSTAECMRFLSAEVDRVLAATGARQVVLIANSRGGYAVRNYIAHGGGAAKVSHAILCGTPNHGVWADIKRAPGSEFNGAGAFLTGLNAPKGANGDEVTPGVQWLTIRSDHNDKYAQPDGAWIGTPGTPTHVGYDGPALKGAENVVIAGIDHRETAFSAAAFEAMLRFLTGRTPASPAIAPEARVVLDGKVSGYGVDNLRGTAPSNLPLAGATVEVYATSPTTGERIGAAVHRKAVNADGRWGPFVGDGQARYEFVIAAPGYAATHLYRSPFPRGSNIVNLRAERLVAADRGATAVVTLTRPRGYFGVPRDHIDLDGRSPPPGVPTGVPGVSSATLRLDEQITGDGAGRAVAGEFNGERIVGRAWPVAGNALVFLELTY